MQGLVGADSPTPELWSESLELSSKRDSYPSPKTLRRALSRTFNLEDSATGEKEEAEGTEFALVEPPKGISKTEGGCEGEGTEDGSIGIFLIFLLALAFLTTFLSQTALM